MILEGKKKTSIIYRKDLLIENWEVFFDVGCWVLGVGWTIYDLNGEGWRMMNVEHKTWNFECMRVLGIFGRVLCRNTDCKH